MWTQVLLATAVWLGCGLCAGLLFGVVVRGLEDDDGA
jgi:hypothetical protein